VILPRRQNGVRTLRIMIVALLVALGAGACSSGGDAQIDWVDFVRVKGREYVHVGGTRPEPPAAALGPVVARVRRALAGRVHDPAYRTHDGDAGFLAVGTPIRRLAGFAPRFRVGVLLGGRVTVYQSDDSHARVGGTLFDLRAPAISGVEIRSLRDGSILGRSSDRALVAMMVTAVMDGAIHRSAGVAGTATCVVAFTYAEAPPVLLAYDQAKGTVRPGIALAPDLRQRLADLGCRSPAATYRAAPARRSRLGTRRPVSPGVSV
jgi:hypothetical protein